MNVRIRFADQSEAVFEVHPDTLSLFGSTMNTHRFIEVIMHKPKGDSTYERVPIILHTDLIVTARKEP
jgi:hypothetical protein